MATAAKKVTAKKVSPPKRGSARLAVTVFQWREGDAPQAKLDAALVALEVADVGGDELRELALAEGLLKSAKTKGAALWGLVSSRFNEKTGLAGADLLAQIAANPGHDVYFCNPHVSDEALYHNTWMQGETEFAKFLGVSQAVFKAAGLDATELLTMQPSASYARGNFLVATPVFWAAYLTFVRKVFAAAEKKLPAEVLRVLHSPLPDPRGVYKGATYVPLIAERLFGYFMRHGGSGLRGHKLSLPKCDAQLNVHQKLLREMKDVAHQTKSAWLGACWVNYRNLYWSQNNSKAWSAKYLRAMTPSEIRFS